MIGRRPVLAPVLIAMVALLPAAAPTHARAAAHAGDQVDFTLTLMDGSAVAVTDLHDKLTVVEFWATWCGPCVQILPHLKALNETYAPRGVELISVSLDDDAAVAQRFIDENQMTWPQAHEGSQDRVLSDEWGTSGIPHAFIIAPGGELLWRGHPAEMEPQIEKALQIYGDKLDASPMPLQPAIRAVLKASRDLEGGGDAIPQVARLVLNVPAEHYADRVMAKVAGKLHAALKEVDPDGTRLRAALDVVEPTDAQTLRIHAFMGVGEAAAADDQRDRG